MFYAASQENDTTDKRFLSVILTLLLLVAVAPGLAAAGADDVTADFTVTPEKVGIGSAVTFKYGATGDVKAASWDFGDGSATLDALGNREVPHTYGEIGKYKASLEVVNGDKKDKKTKTVEVVYEVAITTAPATETPDAPLIGIAPLNVQFTCERMGLPVKYEWDFGDDSDHAIYTETYTTTHPYTTPGTYEASVVATDAKGRYANAYKTIIVKSTTDTDSPKASFTTSTSSGAVPLDVTFTSTSTGSPTSFEWNFGDNSAADTTSGATVTHKYTKPDEFTAKLTVKDAAGKTDTTDKKITAKYDAAFTANVTSGTAPLVVKFTDTSAGSPVKYDWEFGDGTRGENTSVVVCNYTKAGTYVVTLKITDAYGNTDNEIKTIKVTEAEEPEEPVAVNFTVTSASSGVAPLKVWFKAQDVDKADTYNWDFGEGTKLTTYDGDTEFGVIYAKAGTYDVKLTVKDDATTLGELTKKNCIVVTNEAAPALKINDFTASVTKGEAPLKVTFTSDVTGENIVDWNWTFEPVSEDYYSKHPVSAKHTFTKPGVYNITLSVTDSTGATANLTKASYITVTEKEHNGRRNIDVCSAAKTTEYSGDAPLTVHFYDKSKGCITARTWDFGDGATSTEKSPTHIYEKAGKYTVTLTVENDHGCETKKVVGNIAVTD